jgi:hypothetical protein
VPKKADQRSGGKRPAAKATFDQDVDASWHRYRQQPIECSVCHDEFIPRPASAKTCGKPKCKKEYKRRCEQERYNGNLEFREKKIAQGIASRKRRHKPIIKHCIAPHPTIPGALCGKEFVAKGRDLTCSPECGHRKRMALQRDRYHADPQAARDRKNGYYAKNLAKPVGLTRCPNPACGRQYLKRRSNQETCGRPACHEWKYGITHREEINGRKRKKRRENPGVDAAYQRDYRAKNPEKFKGYRPKINERQQRRRAEARQTAIAAGTFVDRRRKVTDSQKAKIVKQRRAGKTLKQIAKSFGIHFATVARICDTR